MMIDSKMVESMKVKLIGGPCDGVVIDWVYDKKQLTIPIVDRDTKWYDKDEPIPVRWSGDYLVMSSPFQQAVYEKDNDRPFALWVREESEND